MEKKAANRNSYIQLLSIFSEALLSIICHWMCTFQKFFSRFLFFLSFPVDSFNSNIGDHTKKTARDSPRKQPSSRGKQEEGILSREEAKQVMEKLGLVCSPDSNKLQGFPSPNELSGLFEDEEPSLEEVKEAFDVFDYNREGFIDARKLQRVLCILRFKEGSRLEDCEKMIKRLDENGHGSINFNEFVKFMEKNF